MTVQKVLSSQPAPIVNNAIVKSGGNLNYSMQTLFLRITSQLSRQNQETQKRNQATKKEYRLSTAKAAGFQRAQGSSPMFWSSVALAATFIQPAASSIEKVGPDLAKLFSDFVSGGASRWGDYKLAQHRASETPINAEAQIHLQALQDSAPKGDENTLKTLLEQLMSYIRDTYKSAAR